MTRDALEGFEKYDTARRLQPGSAELAAKLFDYCRQKHGARLCWPVGPAGWIVAEPNYFAFQSINQQRTEIVVDIFPTNWNYFQPCNVGSELQKVVLSGRGQHGRFNDSKFAQMTISSSEQLPTAHRILDFAYQWVTDNTFKRQEMQRMREAHANGKGWPVRG